ncbi:sigma-70 family RNA polymerase sigma factor [Trebonia kvetii]|uniref:Sigma-70 family RNA polymerase sigma factor n=1 Tax=Trebonia kvetii TaxID=2480626 RepID=A0A6P2C3Y8_9ACTN|nr:RNA polymerase subunit sigma-70 [Trebonia kvetii]TVZ06132.1 sigma-70 family RNA polymerase sigma factor [Trebonia kvetii]
MDVLDEARFTELSERHRHELQVHSYRMLGNFEQAEDAVQEALLRAWKGRASFDGGPAARAWLYRIVTTTCFDILRAAQRRPEQIQSIADVPWIQPYPDVLLDAAAEPEGAAIRRETVELAYLAVIQLLPARQRAVLLLRDVQGYSGAETAQMLGMSVPAMASALQRARATLEVKTAARDGDWSPDGITDADRALLAAFVDAHQRQDPDAGLAVIREDIRLAMPPDPGLFTGKDALAGFMARAYDRSIFGDWKLLPTAANRMPAAASYLRRAGSDRFVPFKLDVFRAGSGLIAEITTFDASLIDRFGLPPFLPADDR